jgi:ribonuclease HI
MLWASFSIQRVTTWPVLAEHWQIDCCGEEEMRVYIWCDGAAMPNGGPAGAGYVVVGGVHLLDSEALGDATNNVAEYTAVRNALRAAADAGATSAHVRMDSTLVFGHLSGASRARAKHLIQLKEEVEAQVDRYPGRVTFARISRELNGVADELAKSGARASKALSAGATQLTRKSSSYRPLRERRSRP